MKFWQKSHFGRHIASQLAWLAPISAPILTDRPADGRTKQTAVLWLTYNALYGSANMLELTHRPKKIEKILSPDQKTKIFKKSYFGQRRVENHFSRKKFSDP